MGIAFALVGLVLIITAAQNTYAQLGAQLTKDFTGPGNFSFWFAALLLVGVLGYIPALRKFSTWFMALVLLALFLSKGQNFFGQFSAALASGPAPATPLGATPAAPSAGATSSQASPGTITGNIVLPNTGLPTPNVSNPNYFNLPSGIFSGNAPLIQFGWPAWLGGSSQ